MVLLSTAVVPPKHVRVASNLLGLAGSLFIATQLVMIYRPAVNPVPIASPLAEEWMVGQGGHSELVNYHHVSSTQRDALDILQARDGSTHESGRRKLTSYYIYGKPVLAPADRRVGEQVNVGQQIAKVGNPGNTTERHLHIQAQTIGAIHI